MTMCIDVTATAKAPPKVTTIGGGERAIVVEGQTTTNMCDSTKVNASEDIIVEG